MMHRNSNIKLLLHMHCTSVNGAEYKKSGFHSFLAAAASKKSLQTPTSTAQTVRYQQPRDTPM